MGLSEVLLSNAVVSVTQFFISSLFSWCAFNVRFPGRWCFAPLILIFGLFSFQNLPKIPSWNGIDSLWGLFISIYLMHITSALYIEGWVVGSTINDPDRVTHGPEGTIIPSDSWNFKAAIRAWRDARWLYSETHAKGSPLSRKSFATLLVAKLVLIEASRRAYTSFIFPGYLNPNIVSFDSYHEHYISRLLGTFHARAPITLRETLIRVCFAWDFAIQAYILLSACHHLLALFFACVVRLDEPHEWPALFGSPFRITSVRRFWGGFWHRIVVRPYSSYALVLSRKVLRLEPGSGLEKWLVAFCIFLFSGLAHSAVSWQMGYCGYWRDTFFFVSCFGVVLVEMAVQRQCEILAKAFGLEKGYYRFVNGCCGKMLGFLWVWSFFFWILPKWHFPKIYCSILVEAFKS